MSLARLYIQYAEILVAKPLTAYIQSATLALAVAMAIIISKPIREKLETRHGVSTREVEQCFENRTGHLLLDTREEHQTDPPTMWFVALTNKARLLKVCFITRDGNHYVRTAYDPNAVELSIYRSKGKPSDF